MNCMCVGVVQGSELPPLEPTPPNKRTEGNDRAGGQRDEGVDAAAAGVLGAGGALSIFHHFDRNIKQSPRTKFITVCPDIPVPFIRV